MAEDRCEGLTLLGESDVSVVRVLTAWFPPRYTMAAQDLVMRARGVLRDRGWRIANDRLGSGDDISVYIIPLMHGNRQT